MASPQWVQLPATPGPIRRTLRFLLWSMVICFVVFTGWRLLGPDLGWPVVILMAYTPYIALAAVVPLLLAALLKAGRLLAVLVVCVCVLIAVIAPRAIADPQPGDDGPRLRVLSVNLLGGGGDIDTVISLVKDEQIDVLSVQELDHASVAEIDAAGMAELLPHQRLAATEGSAGDGSGIYSKHPLRDAPELEFEATNHMPAAVLDVPEVGDVEFIAVHPAAPDRADAVPNWRRDLQGLPRADKSGPPRVLAGDFNATVDHALFRELLDSGYSDAADTTGTGLRGTWQPHPLVPSIVLDHILTGPGTSAIDLAVHPIDGGDHAAISATVTLPSED